MNEIGIKERIPVSFIAQPSRFQTFFVKVNLICVSRSPDFNALDLGAWRSLAAGVPSIKCKDKSGRLIDRIVFHVLDRWNSWDAIHRLSNIFNTKSRVMKAVSLVNGSNEYEMPRSSLSHSQEKATYIPRKLNLQTEIVGSQQVVDISDISDKEDELSQIPNEKEEIDEEGEEKRDIEEEENSDDDDMEEKGNKEEKEKDKEEEEGDDEEEEEEEEDDEVEDERQVNDNMRELIQDFSEKIRLENEVLEWWNRRRSIIQQ